MRRCGGGASDVRPGGFLCGIAAATYFAVRKTNARPVESVDSALRLLLLLSEKRQLRVTDAAEALGVAPSTAYRLLNTLRYRNFAVQDESKAYGQGPAFGQLRGLAAPAAPDLRAALHPYAEELHGTLGETCHLMVLEGNGARFIDCVETTQVLRVGSRVGMLLPAHATAGGKALLAELPADRLRALYPRDLPNAPGAATTERVMLQRKLAAVRRHGYATNFGESGRGIAAVGACVRNSQGESVAALAVALPSTRCPRSRVRELATEVCAVAKRASEAL